MGIRKVAVENRSWQYFLSFLEKDSKGVKFPFVNK